VSQKTKAQESAEERDARMEKAYTYDREGQPGTLEYVSANRKELAAQFLEWVSKTENPDHDDLLSAWERTYFGAELWKLAHSMLLFEVTRQLKERSGIPIKLGTLPARQACETNLDYIHRLALHYGYLLPEDPPFDVEERTID